jgi:hypothetical protein
VASKVLKVHITVDEFQTSIMDKHQLQDYVQRNLFAQMTSNIINEMTIEKDPNPNIGISTYTGTLHIGASTTSTISGYNGVASTFQETELRVVEFTKKGKVTKVELQQYTHDGWRRVPRIQIEEK